MADKTYDIEVKTTADTTGVTSIKDELTETKNEAEEVNSSMEQLGDSVSNIDSSNIEDLNEKTQETSDTTSEASDNTEQLGISITSIDPSVIDALRDSMSEYKESAQESADTTNDLMTGLVSGGIATGLSGTFMGLADATGSYNDSVLRMGLALEGHAMTVDEVNQKYGASVSKVASDTGRGAGSVRNHFSNMAIAGVTSQQTLESSFQAVANGSFYSGESIESLSNKFQRISMTGMLSAKQLSGLGLTMEDLASVMGVSAEDVSNTFKTMSAEQRASVMSQASANKYGTEVNDVYKNSWEGLWQQFDKAKGKGERLVGELILPYLVPAVQTATQWIDNLSTTFQNLPAPVKAVFGGILLLLGGITTLGLGLKTVMTFGKLVLSPFQAIGKLFGIDLLAKTKNLATAFLDLGKKVLISGYNALKSAGMWVVQKTQLLASSVASGIATIKNWALAISEWAVANPIYIIIIAIVVLIAVLGYLYFNNEQVKNAIDGLGQTLYNIGTIIYGYLVQAFNIIVTTLQGVWEYITTLGGLLPEGVNMTGNQIIDGILSVMMFIATLPLQLAMIFVNMIASALGFGNNFAQKLFHAGQNAVTNFTNQITSLPGKLQTELSNMLSAVGEWASTLPQKFWDAGVNAVKNFLGALGIASPGIMQRKLIAEMQDTGDRIPDASQNIIRNVGNVGKDVTDAFGEHSFGMDLTATGTINNGSIENILKQILQKLNGNQVFNISIGSVDDEKRIREFIDAVKRDLSWDNETAGRGV